MGMDLQSTARPAIWFASTGFTWRPLVAYITTRYPALTASCSDWHTNSGHGLDAAHAAQLADAIDTDLAAGYTTAYADQHEAHQRHLPTQPCRPCSGGGILHQPGVRPRRCPFCDGTGRRPHPDTRYVFTTEHARAFAAFLHQSGGFRIL